jgi:hypothetical protein
MTPKEFNNEVFDLMEINDVSVLFTPARINRNIVPADLYVYDIRSNDDGTEDYCVIENKVLVNHTGTIISKTPFDFKGNDFIPIEDYGFFGECTLSQYIENKMEIEEITAMGDTYRLFRLVINDEVYCIAEEKLELLIQRLIDEDKYNEVRHIDGMYGYYMPQHIADTEDEQTITEYMLNVID